MKVFVWFGDSDPDLNYFTEADFEKNYEYAVDVDSAQRWMRDARVGDIREFRGRCIVCCDWFQLKPGDRITDWSEMMRQST